MSATARAAQTTGTSNPHRPAHAGRGKVLAVALGLTAVLCLLVVAFAWPATQLAPRSLPIVVAGPAEATAQIGAALDKAAPGGFAVTVVPDEAAARAAIERRDAYGAVVLGQTPSVLTASAALGLFSTLSTITLMYWTRFSLSPVKRP